VLFIEPLDSQTWFREIEALLDRARRSLIDVEEQLRHAYHLMQMAPSPIREIIRPACDESRFEQLLDCAAFESAALALIPEPLKYSIARECDTRVLAAVALPGDDTGHFSAADGCASALLQAWALSIASLKAGRVAQSPDSSASEAHLSSPKDGFLRSAGI
jgi:hypothetical protein